MNAGNEVLYRGPGITFPACSAANGKSMGWRKKKRLCWASWRSKSSSGLRGGSEGAGKARKQVAYADLLDATRLLMGLAIFSGGCPGCCVPPRPRRKFVRELIRGVAPIFPRLSNMDPPAALVTAMARQRRCPSNAVVPAQRSRGAHATLRRARGYLPGCHRGRHYPPASGPNGPEHASAQRNGAQKVRQNPCSAGGTDGSVLHGSNPGHTGCAQPSLGFA